ncbi:C40 family peptidase [Methylobacter sp. Wu1]|uniref:C40 family peptidase n=1 Tax=Methylobacter sp. Wu1 TaxID=3119359 RepID=UPI002F93BEB8
MKNSAGSNNLYFSIRLALALVAVLFAGCAHEPKVAPARPMQSQRPPVVDYALSLQGVPYRYGKDSPQEGFDCSGFIKHVYERQGISLPRTTREMARSLPSISIHDLSSGDLVFFNTNGRQFSHVGLYISDNNFIHAPSQRTGRVLVSSLNNQYWRQHLIGARRPIQWR